MKAEAKGAASQQSRTQMTMHLDERSDDSIRTLSKPPFLLSSLFHSSLGAAALQAAPGAGETVERPEPGIARGRWEAPEWCFYAIAMAVLFGGATWIATTMRARRARRTKQAGATR